jgi:metal-responsive CopG/Arc/MetJ family transcriptional regulator
VAVNTRIPQDLLDEIDRLAEEHGCPRAEMIRTLLREAVERKRKRSAPESGGPPVD